jgi:hypothetical protein
MIPPASPHSRCRPSGRGPNRPKPDSPNASQAPKPASHTSPTESGDWYQHRQAAGPDPTEKKEPQAATVPIGQYFPDGC